MSLPSAGQVPESQGPKNTFLRSIFGSSQPTYNFLSTLTPFQQGVADMLGGNIAKGSATNAQGVPLASGLNPKLTAKYIKQSVATPLLRAYDTQIMPRINDAYASVGALTSSRRGFANQQALQGLQTTIGQALGNAQLQNQQLAVENALKYSQLGSVLTGQEHMAIQGHSNPGGLSQFAGGLANLGMAANTLDGLGGLFSSGGAKPVGGFGSTNNLSSSSDFGGTLGASQFADAFV